MEKEEKFGEYEGLIKRVQRENLFT